MPEGSLGAICQLAGCVGLYRNRPLYPDAVGLITTARTVPQCAFSPEKVPVMPLALRHTAHHAGTEPTLPPLCPGLRARTPTPRRVTAYDTCPSGTP